MPGKNRAVILSIDQGTLLHSLRHKFKSSAAAEQIFLILKQSDRDGALQRVCDALYKTIVGAFWEEQPLQLRRVQAAQGAGQLTLVGLLESIADHEEQAEGMEEHEEQNKSPVGAQRLLRSPPPQQPSPAQRLRSPLGGKAKIKPLTASKMIMTVNDHRTIHSVNHFITHSHRQRFVRFTAAAGAIMLTNPTPSVPTHARHKHSRAYFLTELVGRFDKLQRSPDATIVQDLQDFLSAIMVRRFATDKFFGHIDCDLPPFRFERYPCSSPRAAEKDFRDQT
ncbi:hypothetical protein QBC46DRAFT_433208 [Diplogelasinospora grovesii]|uniref:Uncharacterized protein n=1 Tax=Diplogelasinospora grovesii TaxID=303347 RepID=A0AAN6N8U3_9PEZI|nr:hypothetical protein QBC46DRAFT_433208 [Diplogelasinospora grovesii]